METHSPIHFPKLEQQQFDEFDQLMFLGDHLQRSSLDTNYLTYNLPSTPSIEYPPPLFTQQNYIINNEIIPQTIENNIIVSEHDFHLWNECPPLCDDAWTPLTQLPTTTIPCTFDTNPNYDPDPMNSNPNYLFDQNDLLNDQIFLLNNPNHDNYYNDQPLNTLVEDGVSMESIIQGNLFDGDYNNNINYVDIKHNNMNNYNMKVPKIETIHYEEISKYFDMPISKAAKELNVGLTVLKKRCRELNIKRWPHRKIKSLESLISNVKEMGLMEIVQFLEEHKMKLHYIPGLELNEETKKLRQACFKANYKKRRASLALAHR